MSWSGCSQTLPSKTIYKHDTYSVGDFEREAKTLLQKLFKKHYVVILVGGSGLGEKALLEGLDEFPDIETSIRQNLNQELKENGLHALQEKLKELDPVSFQKYSH